MGVGVKAGLDAQVAVMRRVAQHYAAEGRVDRALLKIDLANAFNRVSRERVLSAVRLHAPLLWGYVAAAYGTHSLLFFGDRALTSECRPAGAAPFFSCPVGRCPGG